MQRLWNLYFIATAGLLLSFLGGAQAAAAERPNILWISLEDISPDLGCYGDAYAITPNLDKFASEGARFTRAFTHAGVCAPSRSGIITGMYPTSIGTHYMRCKGVPPAYVKCFPEYLRAAGYYCTNDTKTDYNFDVPVSAWDDTRPGAHYKNRPRSDQPFFAVINLTSTHESQVRLAPSAQQVRRNSLSEQERHDPAKAVLPPYYPDTPVVRQDWANYYDNLTFADKQVGKILAELDAAGLADKTIVVCFGDHGRGLSRAKRWVYDSGIRVPLMVRWPSKIAPGTVRDDLVAFVDLAPTMLALAGIERPQHFQGQVFLGDAAAAPRDYIYAARDRMDETLDIIRAVRDKRFKYIRNYRPDLPYAQHIAYMDEMPMMKEWRKLHAEGKLEGPSKLFFAATKPLEELYDTDADPHEINNLAEDPKFAKDLERLRAAHLAWRESTGDLGLIPEAEVMERARPSGKFATTSSPVIKKSEEKLTITCATEGASIVYRWETEAADDAPAEAGDLPREKPAGKAKGKQQAGGRGTNVSWQLYTGPMPVVHGAKLRAKACRLGYLDSEVAVLLAE